MKRRHLLAVGGAAGVFPLRARAQPATLPRIGYVSGRSYATDAHLLQAFREGLKSTGYTDGQNVMSTMKFTTTKPVATNSTTPCRMMKSRA